MRRARALPVPVKAAIGALAIYGLSELSDLTAPKHRVATHDYMRQRPTPTKPVPEPAYQEPAQQEPTHPDITSPRKTYITMPK